LRAVRTLGTAIARCLGSAAFPAIAALMCASMAVNAAPLRIVAIGASNTHGGTLAIKAQIPRNCRPCSDPR